YALDAASFEEARDDYCRCILRDLEHWREAPYYVSCDQPWHSTIDRRLPATWRQIFSETAHLRRQASAPASRYHFLRKPIEIPRHHKTVSATSRPSWQESTLLLARTGMQIRSADGSQLTDELLDGKAG